jgi:transcriptional regulator with XRE-family HTH domain
VEEITEMEAAVKFPHVRYATFLRGLTQHQLSRLVGMSPARMCRCERGIQEFTTEERVRIARFLGFDEQWLFERPKPKPRVFDTETTAAVA